MNDLALKFKDGRWDGKLDIFAIQQTWDDRQSQASERQLDLSLLPETYHRLMETGIAFERLIERKPGISYVRMIVVDEGSDRLGSVTFSAEVLSPK